MTYLDNYTMPVWAVLAGYVLCLAVWALVGWWLSPNRTHRRRDTW